MANVLFRRGTQEYINNNVPISDGQVVFNETDEAIYVDSTINGSVVRKRYAGGNLSRSDIDMTLSTTSENPVANKVVTNAIGDLPSLQTDVKTNLVGAINEVNTHADTAQSNIDAEATARANADTTLQNNINAEATARQTADNTLQGNINSEAATRASADSNLQSQINQIVAPSGEAPSAAEVQNARIGADGVTYSTLGDAIRGNDNNLKNDLSNGNDTFSEYAKHNLKTSMIEISIFQNEYGGENGYYKSSAPYKFISDANTKSTGMIYIKGYDVMKAIGVLNRSGFAIAFFDEFKRIIPAISVVNDTSNPTSTDELTFNLNENQYSKAFYCVVACYDVAGLTSKLQLEQTSNFTNEFERIKQIADEDLHDVEMFCIHDDFKENFLYFSNSNKKFVDADVKSTGLIPIRKGAKITACSRTNKITYSLCFLDEQKQVLSSISIKNNADRPIFELHNIDCSSDDYNNIAYVITGGYQSNYTYLFITYPSKSLAEEFSYEMPSISMEKITPDSIGGFDSSTGAFGSPDTATRSTKLIPFNNKYVSRVVAKTYINNIYYKIAFLDDSKNIIQSISLINTGSNAILSEDTIDVSGHDYDSAKYVVVTTLDSATHGEYLQFFNKSYVEKISSVFLNKQTARIFKKVVCVGDSYTAGWHKVAGDSGFSDHPEYAWPHYISDITGNDWLNCGVSGATSLSWMSNPNGYAKAQSLGVSQAYVIGLMINDTANVPLGTSSDIGDENPTTYYGGLSKVIRSVASISPNAHIFVNTCPKTGATYSNFNQAVRDVVNAYANTYKVHLMDLAAHKDMYNEPSFTGDAINAHYTAIGYEQMANIYCYLLSDYINNHISTFQDVYKIPFDPVS
jgi:hypothetical protein